jgi:hypothetical protein
VKPLLPTNHRGAALLTLAALVSGCAATESPQYLRYALGVPSGQCPPDGAFYHAIPPGARTELGVVAAAEQVVSYRVTSAEPAFDGWTDEFTVTYPMNGHTFAIDVPMSAITAVSVTATGASGELPSTCDAVPL